ncbi:hypothetical protein LJR015_001485 [Peribacillus frigoritolerans]|uniref:hypothetical protein n=1 Tax=Peribacillus frigoritolerans TaxID=450367 RepID=UPI003ED14D19
MVNIKRRGGYYIEVEKVIIYITALFLSILGSATGASAAETEGLVNSQETSFTQEPDGTGGLPIYL